MRYEWVGVYTMSDEEGHGIFLGDIKFNSKTPSVFCYIVYAKDKLLQKNKNVV